MILFTGLLDLAGERAGAAATAIGGGSKEWGVVGAEEAARMVAALVHLSGL